MQSVERLVNANIALLAALSFDDNGVMLGNKWVGGNGGLISSETITCADALRRALADMQKSIRGESK